MLNFILRQASKELKSSLNVLQKRNFIFRRKVSENTFRRRDKIDEAFRIIYKAPMEIYLQSCNYVTTISAVIFSGFAIHGYLNRYTPMSSEQKEFELAKNNATLSEVEIGYFALCLVGFCVALRLTLNRYPLRIYKNKTDFIAVFEGNIPTTKQKVSFEKGQVKRLAPTGILPWKDSRYMINDSRQAILYYDFFRTPSELENMCTAPKKAK